MKTCKDCIHNEMCPIALSPDHCLHFKDKSKFIELPCSIGDDIWIVMCCEGKPLGIIIQDKVQMIGITSRGIHIKARNHHEHNKMYMFGKAVFLTREEAEKKLEELK